MKRTRIVALVSTLCICLALFATGVWAIASTVLFSLNGNLKYYPEGVYVELSGQVYRGDSLDTLEPITSNSRFTLEKQTNFDYTDGEPNGNFPIKRWDIGSLPFAPQLRFIKIEVNVTNYSDFDIQGTAQNTIDGTNLEITDNVTTPNIGGLVGVAIDGASLINCSISNVSIKIDTYTTTTRAGGLIGVANMVELSNCFAQNVNINIKNKTLIPDI